MDNEEERQEQRDDSSLISGLRDKTKKANKSKFTMMLRKALAILHAIVMSLKILWPVLIALIFITAISQIIDFSGSSRVAGVATSKAMKESMGKNQTGIAYNHDEGYYFKLDKNFVDTYLEELNRAYDDGYFLDSEPAQDDSKPGFTYDPETAEIQESDIARWFKTDKYRQYLIKMIRAEIASSYPRFGDYNGINSDELGNPLDENGNYVVQGVVNINRVMLDEETGEEIPIGRLDYIPKDQLEALIANANGLDEVDPYEILKYYTFDEENDSLYYAIYTKTVVTIDNEEPEIKYEFKLDTPIAYKSIMSTCSMPYNFLFALLERTKNPEWVMKVVDLLLEESRVEFMIQDQRRIITRTEINRQAQKTETKTYEVKVMDTQYMDLLETDGPYYNFPAGREQTVVTDVYLNSAVTYIELAKTWCLDFAQEAGQEKIVNIGEDLIEEHETAEYPGLSYRTGTTTTTRSGGGQGEEAYREGEIIKETTTSLSTSMLLYSTKVDTTTYKYNIYTKPKEINSDRFLGLWKNDRGTYYEGCIFDPNGKLVGYPSPTDERDITYPVTQISDHNGQKIDGLLELLALHNDTETCEQLMMYFWNKYMNEDIYKARDDLTSLFNTQIISVGSSAGAIPVSTCTFERQEFIDIVVNYSMEHNCYDRLGRYADIIYDICTSKGVNPVLCVATAGQESGFGASVPSNSPFNYWGHGVYNDTQTGTVFSSMEDAVSRWCDTIIRYQTPGTSENNTIIQRSENWKQYDSHFTGTASNFYDLWTIYAYLGDKHSGTMWGNVHVKEFIVNYLGMECNHGWEDFTTDEEKAKYIVFYVNQVTNIGKNIFGTKAITGDTSAVAEYALGFVRRKP